MGKKGVEKNQKLTSGGDGFFGTQVSRFVLLMANRTCAETL